MSKASSQAFDYIEGQIREVPNALRQQVLRYVKRHRISKVATNRWPKTQTLSSNPGGQRIKFVLEGDSDMRELIAGRFWFNHGTQIIIVEVPREGASNDSRQVVVVTSTHWGRFESDMGHNMGSQKWKVQKFGEEADEYYEGVPDHVLRVKGFAEEQSDEETDEETDMETDGDDDVTSQPVSSDSGGTHSETDQDGHPQADAGTSLEVWLKGSNPALKRKVGSEIPHETVPEGSLLDKHGAKQVKMTESSQHFAPELARNTLAATTSLERSIAPSNQGTKSPIKQVFNITNDSQPTIPEKRLMTPSTNVSDSKTQNKQPNSNSPPPKTPFQATRIKQEDTDYSPVSSKADIPTTHPAGTPVPPLPRPMLSSSSTNIIDLTNESDPPPIPITIIFIDDTNTEQHRLPFNECKTAEDLFEEACTWDVADRETRMLEVNITGCAPVRIRRNKQTHFDEKVLGALKKKVRDLEERGEIVVEVRRYM